MGERALCPDYADAAVISSRHKAAPTKSAYTPKFDWGLYQPPFPRHETRPFLSPGLFCQWSITLLAALALDRQGGTDLANSGKKLTSIKIRVGLLGDEPRSIAILDKIKAGL